MSEEFQLKVSDKLVDCGQVFRIYKIRKDKSFNGKREDYIYYKPLYKSDNNQTFVCSIPISNFEEANLRRPVTPKKIKRTLEILSEELNGETTISVQEAIEYFKENDPLESARLLKLLWLEKQDEEKQLSTKKKMIYQKAMKHLEEEVAVVQNIGITQARMKIVRRLKKVYPQKEEEKDKK